MSMGGTDNVREYYRLVTEMDIGEVAGNSCGTDHPGDRPALDV